MIVVPLAGTVDGGAYVRIAPRFEHDCGYRSMCATHLVPGEAISDPCV